MSPIRLTAPRPIFAIARPLAGALALVWLIGAYAGAYAILLGVSLMALESQLYGLRRRVALA